MCCLSRAWKEISPSVLKSNRKSRSQWWKGCLSGGLRAGQLSSWYWRFHLPSTQCYEEFICRSPLDSCIFFHEGGHWRELVVRTTSCGHTMAIITFHPQELGQVSMRRTRQEAQQTSGWAEPAGCIPGERGLIRLPFLPHSWQEALATQKALLKEFFTCGPGAVCALTSLYFQER